MLNEKQNSANIVDDFAHREKSNDDLKPYLEQINSYKLEVAAPAQNNIPLQFEDEEETYIERPAKSIKKDAQPGMDVLQGHSPEKPA